METKFIVVLCTVPDQSTAENIARKLVNEKLAACCNIVPGLQSFYFWKGEAQSDKELLLLIKTSSHIFKKLQNRITELHPYEVPEIIALPILIGNNAYLNWVEENVE